VSHRGSEIPKTGFRRKTSVHCGMTQKPLVRLATIPRPWQKRGKKKKGGKGEVECGMKRAGRKPKQNRGRRGEHSSRKKRTTGNNANAGRFGREGKKKNVTCGRKISGERGTQDNRVWGRRGGGPGPLLHTSVRHQGQHTRFKPVLP